MLKKLYVVSMLVCGISSHSVTADSGSDNHLSNQAKKLLPKPAKPDDFIDNGTPDAGKVELGKNLFYDKILSGNLNISCATCHHALAGTGDGLSLPSGEGAKGIGVSRDIGSGADEIHERVPRNSPHIFNIAAKEYVRMFHDGRVEISADASTGFATPAGDDLPEGLENLLSAQAMFPVTSGTEMAGQAGENPQADFAAEGDLPGVWNFIAGKVSDIPEYVEMFTAVYDDVNVAEDITYVHIANALAAFENVAGTTVNSAFDRYLNGDKGALSSNQRKGMKLFYTKAGCNTCHSGTFQTDHEFHAIAMPQVGPGKGDGDIGNEDFGRERVTGNIADRYKFRTPTLRNLAVTAPYGHSGAFDTIESVLMHHLDAVASLYAYDRNQVTLPNGEKFATADFSVMDDGVILDNIAQANELQPKKLSQKEVRYLIDYLGALNDPAIFDMRADVPKSVPSGLPVFD